jgi:oleate hydratase
MRGGRMFTSDNYECTCDLFKLARLVDRERAIVPVTSMGFSMQDRERLLKMVRAGEESFGKTRITDWLAPEFFKSNSWFLWATTFAFQPWHSALEFKRYLYRFMLEFSRIDTLAGVKRTVYNQNDSLVLPLTTWLKARGVRTSMGCDVTNLEG